MVMRFTRMPDGTRLAYNLYGPRLRGETARGRIVLCDGISCDGYIFQHLRPAFEGQYDILHLNYRGHGRSGLPRDPTASTLPHLAADYAFLMAELEFEDAVFIGHSMGVLVALEMAFRYPQRVRAGVLTCGASGRLLDSFKHTDIGLRMLPLIDLVARRFRNGFAAAMRVIMPSPITYLIAATEIRGDRLKPKDFQPYLEHFARMPVDLFVNLLADSAERTTLPYLARLTQPFLVIAGEDDGVTPLPATRLLARTLRDAQLLVVPRTSHTAPIEDPAAFEAALWEFLARLDARTNALPAHGPWPPEAWSGASG